jgi:hypothetical protein
MAAGIRIQHALFRWNDYASYYADVGERAWTLVNSGHCEVACFHR